MSSKIYLEDDPQWQILSSHASALWRGSPTETFISFSSSSSCCPYCLSTGTNRSSIWNKEPDLASCTSPQDHFLVQFCTNPTNPSCTCGKGERQAFLHKHSSTQYTCACTQKKKRLWIIGLIIMFIIVYSIVYTYLSYIFQSSNIDDSL